MERRRRSLRRPTRPRTTRSARTCRSYGAGGDHPSPGRDPGGAPRKLGGQAFDLGCSIRPTGGSPRCKIASPSTARRARRGRSRRRRNARKKKSLTYPWRTDEPQVRLARLRSFTIDHCDLSWHLRPGHKRARGRDPGRPRSFDRVRGRRRRRTAHKQPSSGDERVEFRKDALADLPRRGRRLQRSSSSIRRRWTRK